MKADYLIDFDVIWQAQEHTLNLMLRLDAGRLASLVERRPLNLSVVLDRSGSMEGDKLAYVKKATQFLIKHLGADDRFSLVSYDDVVKVEWEPSPVQTKDAIDRVVEGIYTGGSTNLSGGWLQGCQLVVAGQADNQVNRVLLLTDGLANRGVTEVERLAAMARQKREEGITTTTLGVGMDFNEDLLMQMAAEGGGAFYFIDNPDQAPTIFAEELENLLSVVGQNVTVTLTLRPDVEVVRQFNTYPVAVEGRKLTYRLDDLYADEIKVLLVQLRIPALDKLGDMELAQLVIDFDEMGADQVTHRRIEQSITVQLVDKLEAADQSPDPEVEKNVLLLGAARARDDAMRQADSGDFTGAASTLSGAADAIEQSDLDDPDLQTEHNRLREEVVDMEFGAQRYDSHMRKATATYSFHSTGSTHSKIGMSGDLHLRRKMMQEALERSGETPTELLWLKSESLNLTAVDLVTIGRADDNDIVIADDNVSAHHCVIQRDGSDLNLEDLGSKNGTFANGGQVSQRFRLSAGDVVSVGPVLFRFK